jgi:hypothetical protein
LWGATALVDRSFSIGDSWTIAGECSACTGARTITILEPRTDSPSGTAFVAIYESSTPYPPVLSASTTTIHMGQEAFPLLVQAGNFTFTRSAYRAGAEAVHFTHEATTYPPLFDLIAWEGLPPEGDPIAGVPTLRDAIESTGAPRGLESGGVTRIRFMTGGGWTSVLGTRVVETDEPEWHVVAGSADRAYETQYVHTSTRVLGLPVWLETGWTRREMPAEALQSCLPAVLPELWEQARFATEAGLVEKIEALSWEFACGLEHLHVFGPARGEPIILGARLAESVTVSSRTLTLVSQLYHPE